MLNSRPLNASYWCEKNKNVTRRANTLYHVPATPPTNTTNTINTFDFTNYRFDHLDAQMLKAPQRYRWIGVVEWCAGQAFSAPGDSGALVYTIKQGETVPLGIHLGVSGELSGASIFLCLDSFTIEGKLQELDFAFTDE